MHRQRCARRVLCRRTLAIRSAATSPGKAIVIGGTAPAVGVGGFWVARRQADARRPHPSEADSVDARDSEADQRGRDENRALWAQLAGLEGRVAALSTQVSAQKVDPPTHEEPSASASPTAAETIEHERRLGRSRAGSRDGVSGGASRPAFPSGQARPSKNPDGTRPISVYLSTSTGADGPGSGGS